jgi:hypothetical protein
MATPAFERLFALCTNANHSFARNKFSKLEFDSRQQCRHFK